jgi:hypothetical protein
MLMVRAMSMVAESALIVLAALSLATAQAQDCAPGKLSDYEKLGAKGCALGKNHFSNFTYRQASDGLPAAAISVTPGTVPDSGDPGLLFEAAWVAPSYRGSSVAYTVEVQPSGMPISGVSLEMQFGQITGTGEARVGAHVYPLVGVPDASADLKLDVFLGPGQGKKASDSGEFKNPVRQLRVISPLTIAAGKGGTASLKGFTTVFHFNTEQVASAHNEIANSPSEGAGR